MEKIQASLVDMGNGFVKDSHSGNHILGHRLCVPSETYERLYVHQIEGIKWFWSLYEKGTGGILGDDMGLGKTIQVITFLDAMFASGLIDSALIVLPLSLLEGWQKEFEKWAPDVRVKVCANTALQ